MSSCPKWGINPRIVQDYICNFRRMLLAMAQVIFYEG